MSAFNTLPALPASLQVPLEATRQIAKDPQVAVDCPWSASRLVVLHSIKQWARLTRKTPRTLHVPPLLEAALEIDLARSFNEHGHIRQRQLLFGLKVVWDADEFRIE